MKKLLIGIVALMMFVIITQVVSAVEVTDAIPFDFDDGNTCAIGCMIWDGMSFQSKINGNGIVRANKPTAVTAPSAVLLDQDLSIMSQEQFIGNQVTFTETLIYGKIYYVLVGDHDNGAWARRYKNADARTSGTNINFTAGLSSPDNLTTVTNYTNTYGFGIHNITTEAATASSFTVTVTDFWGGGAINGINVSLGGTTYQNATGNVVTTIILNNASITYDINISGTAHFNSNLTGINVSSNLAATLYQSDIKFRAFELFSGDELFANFTLNSTTYDTNISFYLATGFYNGVVQSAGYYNLSFNSSITALDNLTENVVGLYQTVVNLSVYNTLNGTHISNFSGWYYDVTNAVNTSFNASSNFTIFNVLNGLYYIGVSDTGFDDLLSDYYSFTFTNLTESVNISSFFFDNCSLGGGIGLNLSFFDETTPSNSLNTSLAVQIDYVSAQYNGEFSGNTFYEICFYGSGNITYDMYAQYTTEGGFVNRYYVTDGVAKDNETTQFYLYGFNTTTIASDLNIVAREYATYQYFENVIGKLQRNYLGEGVWRTVQMDKSGDFGNVFFNIIEESVDYRIIFYDIDGNLLKQTETMKFVCSAGICELTQLLNPYSVTTITSDLIVNYTFNNVTDVLYVDWYDSEANNNLVEIRVSKETMTGNLTICDKFQTGSEGTMNCSVSGHSGNIFVVVLTSHSPYTPIMSLWIKLSNKGLSTVLSIEEQAIWTFGIMVTVIGAGLFSPVAAIVTTIFGLFLVFFLGLFSPISMVFVIVAMAIGIAIGIKVKR